MLARAPRHTGHAPRFRVAPPAHTKSPLALSQVDALIILRRGGNDRFGRPVPATVLSERPELSTRRAQEQADDLAGVRTGRALAPGALAWHLVLVDSSGSPPRQLCGRPGWHTPHMFDALTLGIPTRPVTENDELLQSAADTRNYGRLVRSESEAAEAALRRAAAMLKVPAEAEQASVMVPELISLAEAHGERLSTPDTDKRLQELLMALKGLGLRADEYVQKRFNLNRHEARAQVRGGKTGGEHSQQRVQVVWSLRGGGSHRSGTIGALGNLRGDAAPAIDGMSAPQPDGSVRLTFRCGSEPRHVTPPEDWDGTTTPTLERMSVEAGEHSQQRVQVVWSLRGGGSHRSGTIGALGNLRGDAAPAIDGMSAPQPDGSVRLTFRCGSEPRHVTPPEDWDGTTTPTLERMSVEAGETGGEHKQQRVQVVWSLRGGGLLLSDRIRLGNLRGDAAPAIRSMHEEPGRVRLAFACDSPPVYMQPPPGWDGLQPTAQRASVEEQHGPLHERGVYIGSVWYMPDAAALLTLYEQTTTQIPQSGRLDLSEGESRQITILTTQLAALTAAATRRVLGGRTDAKEGTRRAD